MAFPVLELFGRTHPMVLHLPIGMFIALGVLELLMWRRGRAVPPEVRATLLWLATLSAVVTALAGLALSRESAYSGDGVQLHKWLGIAAAGASVLCLAVGVRRAPGRLYGVALALSIAILVPAGHFGASITHGSDFLLEPLHPRSPHRTPSSPASTPDKPTPSPSTPPPMLPPPGAPIVFQRDIAPILAARCVRCHGPDVQKGDLALHTVQAIQSGGQDGPVIDEQDPARSEMLWRVESPADEDGHMPPRGKPQLTPDELRVLAAWIRAGGAMGGADGPSSPSKPSPGS